MIAAGRYRARAIAAGLLVALAACGSSSGSTATPTLDWWVGPDRVDVGVLAESCTTAADGAYRIRVRQLPDDVGERHASLVRTLAAKGTSIDLLSLDSAFTQEFSAARFLAPIPEDLAPAFAKDVAPAALAAASVEGRLVAAPWWFDPQMLWFRGNIAERAGLDTRKAVSWDDLIAGADRLGVSIQIEDRDGSGLSEWVSALVSGAGGAVVDGERRTSTVGLDTEAGRAAASLMEFYRDSRVGPGPSADALTSFAGPTGGFLIAPSSVISDPALASIAADLGWAPYPTVGGPGPGEKSVAPLAGIGLAVPLYAPHSDLSYRAITCLTSPTALAAIMTSAGHSASRLSTYDLPNVKSDYPLAGVTRPAVETGRGVPATPYWHLVRAAIDESWSPVDEVTAATTPSRSQDVVADALRGRLP